MRGIRLLFTVLLLSSALAATAQEFFYRTAPKDPLNRITIGYRYTLPIDVEFSNLGTVPFLDIPAVGAESSGRNYNDGFVFEDSSYIGGESDGLTSFFSIRSPEQRIGNQLIMNQYASRSEGHSVEDDSPGTGWEIQWLRSIPRWNRIGLTIGFSFNQLNAGNSSAFTATLLQRQDIYNLDGLPLFPIGPDGFSGSFLRSGPEVTEFGEPIVLEPQPLVPLLPTNEAPIPLDSVAGGASGSGKWELRSAFYTLRLGSIYDFSIGKAFSVQVGAGVAATYFAGDFSVNESIVVDEDMTTSFYATDRSSDVLFGGYVDATANYQMTERVNLFSGLQYQTMSDYRSGIGDRQVDVKMSGSVTLRAGLGIRF